MKHYYTVSWHKLVYKKNGKLKSFENGTIHDRYDDYDSAYKRCCEEVDNLFNAHLRENDIEFSIDPDNDKIYRDSDKNKVSFKYYNELHEYWVNTI